MFQPTTPTQNAPFETAMQKHLFQTSTIEWAIEESEQKACSIDEDDYLLDAAAMVALVSVPGLGIQKQKILLNYFQGSPRRIWRSEKSFLIQQFPQIFKKSGNLLESWDKICPTDGDLEEILVRYQKANIQLITQKHPQYPESLKEIYDAPQVLFIQGSLEAFNGNLIAFVGTRRVSDYGQRVTEKIIQELAQSKVPNVTIVSGLAQGVDGISHQAALKYKLPTLAVFGAGIDVIYPKNHKSLAQKIVAEGGALISEYPLGTQPTVYTFPQRNRIVAGLSQGVVVVEGNIKSGSLITARCALEENRSVFAAPGNLFNPGSEGPHYLIQQGAVLTLGAQEIIHELKWEPEENVLTSSPDHNTNPVQTVETSLDGDSQKILDLVPYDPILIETVQTQSGLPADKFYQSLTLLELEGRVERASGAQIYRC